MQTIKQIHRQTRTLPTWTAMSCPRLTRPHRDSQTSKELHCRIKIWLMTQNSKFRCPLLQKNVCSRQILRSKGLSMSSGNYKPCSKMKFNRKRKIICYTARILTCATCPRSALWAPKCKLCSHHKMWIGKSRHQKWQWWILKSRLPSAIATIQAIWWLQCWQPDGRRSTEAVASTRKAPRRWHR